MKRSHTGQVNDYLTVTEANPLLLLFALRALTILGFLITAACGLHRAVCVHVFPRSHLTQLLLELDRRGWLGIRPANQDTNLDNGNRLEITMLNLQKKREKKGKKKRETERRAAKRLDILMLHGLWIKLHDSSPGS